MKKDGKNNCGSVYYDKKNKRWKCYYYVRDMETFKNIRKSKTFYTEKEAKMYLGAMQYQKGNELYIKNNGLPLNLLMRANVKKKLDMNVIGERQYARVMKTILKIEKCPVFENNIEDITIDDIQDYLNTLTDYSNSYIQKIYEQFKQVFTLAFNRGYITRNPLVDVIKPKSKKNNKVVRALELEEQQALTNYLTSVSLYDEPYKNVYLIQMYLGLRIGEVLALKSTDINLAKNLISVNKTLTTDKDDKIIMGNSTKTYAGIREVPIPNFMRESIILQMKMSENNMDKLLFVDSQGGYARPKNANRYLKKILDKMGIEKVSTHSLRHTYGTRCVEAGMRAVALQRLMGHKDISVTLNTYTSIFNKYKEAELEKVNQYYMNNELISNFNNMLDK